ncbi:hypothetical protein B0H13DRAFT_2337241 [Mycena leptocephala]|nr:hypothetical protein B0H13DRAFT_2337241 [Mycena leptocephala]
MPLLDVLLVPPPIREKHGIEWLPRGLEYGPFHPAYSPPEEAVDKREIPVSQSFIDQWNEFHSTIEPLLVIPPLESAPPLRLYTAWHAESPSLFKRLRKFLEPIFIRIDELSRALNLNTGAPNLASSCDVLYEAHILTRGDTAIELKMCVNMLFKAVQFIESAVRYEAELHSRCSAWDRFRVKGSILLENLQNNLFQGTPNITPPVIQSSVSSTSASSESSSDVPASVHLSGISQLFHSDVVRRHPHRRASN